MARTMSLYGKSLVHLLNGDVSWKASGGSSFKVVLLKSSYTFDEYSHETYSHLNAASNEVTGTNYTAGGASLVVGNPVYVSATKEVRLPASDTEWNQLTLNSLAKYAVIYCTNNNYLIGCLDFDEPVSSSGRKLIIDWSNEGCFKFTLPA